VENPLRRVDLPDGEFTYEMDFEGLERLAADPSNVLMLLCNPHNPAGRVWRREELERVAEICRRNGVRVVSDEIHCELTMPGYRYVPYGTVDPSAVVCLSPSKAFNTAGLQIANIIVADPEERKLIDRAVNINEVCDVNPFGVEALKAAYSPEGSEWLDALREYIYENYRLLRDCLRQRLPQCAVARLEGTYLPWVDISKLGFDADALAGGMLDKAGVWVNSGSMYGDGAYLRINIACPRQILEEGLERICGYLEGVCMNNRN
ncbi:MAG: aminotransferase class I/II-fold pyridoxal phosphate-dependent enzyme, partial [Duncaniella sp.]|nr:aminotransferase class I/II-fold pyridoxal phosphate-dependent enzyme [Duncaniella sp.]